MNNSESYKIVARHFAETIKVNLTFEENATPRTNGKTIILPTEMRQELVDVTMGALLHETAHIRMTDFGSIDRLSDQQKMCYNALEDIRVDELTYRMYPNARPFQTALIDSVVSSKEIVAKMQKESFPVKVLKALVLIANNYDCKQIYTPEVEDYVNKEIPDFVERAKKANSKEIELMAMELAKKLMDDTFQKAVQQKQKQDSQAGDNGDDAEADADEDYGIDIDQYEKVSQQEKSAQNGIDTSKKGLAPAVDDYNKEVDEYKDVRRRYKINATKQQTLEDEIKDLENKGQDVTQQKAKLAKKQEEVAELLDQYRHAERKCKKGEDKVNSLKRAITSNKTVIQEANNAKQELSSSCFSKSSDVTLLGFEALKNMDFSKAKDVLDEIDIKRSLDDLVKELLILKTEQHHQDEEGAKLNAHRLSEVFTDLENVFLQEEREDLRTHIAFIVDASGSMGYSNYPNESAGLAIGALKVLASAVKRAIDSGAPADFSIYAFADNVVPIIQQYEQYQEKDMAAQYETARRKAGGCTNLAQSVNLVNEELMQKEGKDKIAVIITDAEVDNYEINALKNHCSMDAGKFVFVGVNVNDARGNAYELFGDYNINSDNDACEVLERALFSLI